MKKTILLSLAFIIAVFLICCANPAHAQRYITDSSRNLSNKYFRVDGKDSSVKEQSTNRFWEDKKGLRYPLFVGNRGGIFYYRISKTGKQYKVYPKKD